MAQTDFLLATQNSDFIVTQNGDFILLFSINSGFQPGSKGKKTDPHLYEIYPDFEPSKTYEVEYLLLTL